MSQNHTNQHSLPAPYWRLSSFYFFYFASLGALLPYWNPYLKSLGFSSLQIGLLMAIVMGTKIVAPNIWGWIADRSGKRMSIVRLASLLSVICFAGVFISSAYGWLIIVMFSFSFFWNASLPQFEATTMNYLGTHTHAYNTIRMWGSIGFVLLSVGLGYVIDWQGFEIVPIALLLLFVFIWLSSLIVPERPSADIALDHEPLRKVLARREVSALLLSCFLVQVSHGPYYTFFSIYLEESGYAAALIGELWALGVIAEIVMFLFMYRLLPKIGSRDLLLLAFLLTTIRWIMLALFVDSLVMLIFIQILHAASFGIVHAVAIHLIHRFFIGQHQGRGQALYSSLSFGAGGAIGSLYSGFIWEGLGPVWVFLIAAVFSLVAFIVTWRGIHTH
jgi:PPP family 3-phenylpropionic acid transporter